MSKLGSSVMRFESLASTNDTARELAAAGEPEGVAVVAREQTAGRGTQGRSWSSPGGAGLYLSVILRPEIDPARAPLITLAAAVAVAETLRLDFGARADIKWPNDVLVSGRKICGILAEAATEDGRLQHVILGVGVNLAQREFPAAIRDAATSLLLETGSAASVDDFLPPLLDRLEQWYRAALYRPGEVLDRWQELSSFARGCAVRVTSQAGMVEGITRGLTPGGALRVELDGGEVKEMVSGEVTLRKMGG
jgi:BirA family biotin operon repressor/biotin-[acetyl-CoA-carboxylase] ligase